MTKSESVRLNEAERSVLLAMYEESAGNEHLYGFYGGLMISSIGITPQQLSGYVSQLQRKGLIRTSDEPADYPDMFHITEDGIALCALPGNVVKKPHDERGAVSLPLLAIQAAVAIGIASSVYELVAWAQSLCHKTTTMCG